MAASVALFPPAMVDANSLSEPQLRALLDWNPDFPRDLDAKPMLVAAARNRFPGGLVPAALVPTQEV